MAETMNRPAKDSGKLKQMETQTEGVNHSEYFAELDAIDALGRELDAEHHSESVWDRWEERSIRVCSEIEALPATPGNAFIKSRAVWSIISSDVDELNEGKSRCDRLVRQIVTSLVRTAAANRAQWALCLSNLKQEKAEVLAESSSSHASAARINSSAVDAVLACPAPDIAAVVRKIEIIQEYGREASELASVSADLRRLGGEA